MVLLATVTPTASANVDALSAFTSDYDNYLILGSNLRPASNTDLVFRLGVAGTADTASNYKTGEGINFTGGNTWSLIASGVQSAGAGVSFRIQLIGANQTSLSKFMLNDVVFESASNPAYTLNNIATSYIGTTAVSGIRFFWGNGGNFAAAGKLQIYGYSNT
jgi:hypothetical protein